MQSTRILLLDDGGQSDPKDNMAIQRDVLGVWTDYRVELGTYAGCQLWVVDWDMTTGILASKTPPTGQYGIPVAAFATFTPGIPTNTNVTLRLGTGETNSDWGWDIDILDDDQPKGFLFSPESDATTRVNDILIDRDIQLFTPPVQPSSPPWGGSVRVWVIFVELPPA